MLIDIHIHTAWARHPKLRRAKGTTYPTPERAIRMMDDAGIDRAAVMATVSPEFRYTLVTPEEVLDICGKHPDRLIPFCSLDPRFLTNDATADFRPLLEAYKELGCRGVGEYMPNIPFDHPLNMNLFEQVEESGLPLTFHIAPQEGSFYGVVDEVGLPRLETVLKAFPGLIFLAHSQPFWAEISTDVVRDGKRVEYPEGPVTPGRAVELFRRYENLYGDLSANSAYTALTRDPDFGYRFMEEFQDRLCFATDIANDPQDLPIVGFFEKLKEQQLISTEAYEKIAWRNADRILRLGLA